MCNPPTTATFVPPAANAVAPPPKMSGAANYAIFTLTMLGPLFSFDAQLSSFDIVINLGLTLAATVILTEVCSLVVIPSKNVRNGIEFIKVLSLLLSLVLIVMGFVFLNPGKSNFMKVRPGSASAIMLILKFRGSRHLVTLLFVIFGAVAAGYLIN